MNESEYTPTDDKERGMMTDDELIAIRERLEATVEPLSYEARMEAYYYGFYRTGCGPVDAVLSAVAIAGKGSHNTVEWCERDDYGYYDNRPGLPANPRIDKWTGGSAVDLIQLTAKASAEKVKTLSDDLAALLAEVERLRGQIDAVKKIHEPEEYENPNTYETGYVCSHCYQEDGEWAEYPCPTIRALEGEES